MQTIQTINVKKRNITKNKYSNTVLIVYGAFILLLILNSTINSIVYSVALLMGVALLAVIYDPIYLLAPLLLTSTIQSYFLVTPTLSFSGIISVVYLVACVLHGRVYIKGSKAVLLLSIFMLYHFSSCLWSLTGSLTRPISFSLGILRIIFMYSHKVETDVSENFYKLLHFLSYAFGITIAFLTFSIAEQDLYSQIVFDDNLNANTICSTLALFGVLIYAKALYSTSKYKILDYLFVMVCAVTILIVGSRTSLFGLILVVVALPLLSYRTNKIDIKKLFSLLLVATIVIIVVYLIMMQNEALYKRFTLDESTTTSIDRRTYVWSALWNHVIPDNLIVGIGYGIENVIQAVTPYVNMPTHSHNMFFAILSQTGLVGLIMYVFLLVAVFRRLIKNSNKGSVMILGVLFLALFVGVGEEVISSRWFWLMIGFGLFFVENPPLTEEDKVKSEEDKKLLKKPQKRIRNDKKIRKKIF